MSELPAVPNPDQLSERYTKIMHEEVLGARLETTAAEVRYLDLIEAIIIDQLAKHDARITSDEEDLGCALQMIRWVHSRANDREISEGVAAERAKSSKQVHANSSKLRAAVATKTKQLGRFCHPAQLATNRRSAMISMS